MSADAPAMVSPREVPAPVSPAPAAPTPSGPGPVQPWPVPDPSAAAPWGATPAAENSQSPAVVADDAPPTGTASVNPDLASSGTSPSSEPAHLPRWLWLLAATCLLLLAGWRAASKKSRVLSDETERLARHQRQLQSAHSQLKSQSEHLRHLAINDPLTGTLNRQAFAGDLKQVLEHLARFRRPLNLMLFDLDHFKAINDGLGHLAGDKALKLVVGIVRQHLASEDLFGRFGGDEFLIACADQAIEDTAALAENIRQAVVREAAASDPPLTGLSLSIGIAQANPDTGYLPDVLFHRADTALYAAKNAGRNRVVLADDSLAPPPVIGAATRHLS